MIQTALKVTGIDHVVMHVRDLPRERRFYTEVLGMTVAHENERQCFLHCGNGQQIALFEFDTRALTRDCHPDYRRVVRRERGPIAARI